MKHTVKLKFTNGLNFESGVREILNCVSSFYDFIESDDPDFVIFGPYGDDVPQGKFTKIGYFCECMSPDMSSCDWAFGMPYEDEIQNKHYMRIQWHGFDPKALVKTNINVDKILSQKTLFCNFVYSNPVLYREKFFKELSKYKRVDAPGKSMNNMPSIDSVIGSGDIWTRKREFLNNYKFTIAFENYSYPGYHTEKILDPMVVGSLPIYLGNPLIGQHFNTKSFINAHEYLARKESSLTRMLRQRCQTSFWEFRNESYNQITDKIERRIKSRGRKWGMILEYKDFEELIEKIIEIDKDETLYGQYLTEPWFLLNTPPLNDQIVERWREIFD